MFFPNVPTFTNCLVDVKSLFIFLGVIAGNFDVVHRLNFINDYMVRNLNVSPVPSPLLNPLLISELRPLVKNLRIEFASKLTFFHIHHFTYPVNFGQIVNKFISFITYEKSLMS